MVSYLESRTKNVLTQKNAARSQLALLSGDHRHFLKYYSLLIFCAALGPDSLSTNASALRPPCDLQDSVGDSQLPSPRGQLTHHVFRTVSGTKETLNNLLNECVHPKLYPYPGLCEGPSLPGHDTPLVRKTKVVVATLALMGTAKPLGHTQYFLSRHWHPED